MSEWQPIETAPMDGSYVLAFDSWAEGQLDPTCVVVWWNDDGWDVPYGPQPDSDAFTHWMPLPPAPRNRANFAPATIPNEAPKTGDPTCEKCQGTGQIWFMRPGDRPTSRPCECQPRNSVNFAGAAIEVGGKSEGDA